MDLTISFRILVIAFENIVLTVGKSLSIFPSIVRRKNSTLVIFVVYLINYITSWNLCFYGYNPFWHWEFSLLEK